MEHDKILDPASRITELELRVMWIGTVYLD